MSENLIFDIGANRGLVAEEFVNKGYKLICVEPLPDLCTLIEEKFSETESVICVNAMVSSHAGSKEFFKGSADTLSTSSYEWMTQGRFSRNYQWQSLGEIDCVSIDKLVEDYGTPFYIKVDVEGSEVDAISSLSKKIDTMISFEWVQEFPKNSIDVVKHLRGLGFTEFYIHNHPRGEPLPEDFIVNHKSYSFDNIENFESVLLSNLDDIPGDPAWGDIYVR